MAIETLPPTPSMGADDPQDSAPVRASEKRLGRKQLIWRRFRRNRGALLGLAIIGLLGVVATFGNGVLPWRWDEVDDYSYLAGPSLSHPFGTDQSGRDMLALTVRGMGKSLLVGLCVALLSTGIAAILGSAAAYFGGWVQRVILWVIDLLLVIPSFLLIAIVMSGGGGSENSGGAALIVSLGLQGANSWILLVALITFFSWTLSARVVRSMALSVKEQEFVHAARFMGIHPFKIILRHVIPNLSSLLVVDATLTVGGAILSETILSYLGFGIQPPDVSLGTLIGGGQTQVQSYGWLFFGPAAVLVILVLAVNAVGDGVRDALDPGSIAGGVAR